MNFDNQRKGFLDYIMYKMHKNRYLNLDIYNKTTAKRKKYLVINRPM